jgi:hypothetical protein
VCHLQRRVDTKYPENARPRHHEIISESAAVGTSDTVSMAHARPCGRGRAVATIGALGVVFGDIGTSPIYTVQTIFNPGDPTRSLPRPRVCTDCCPWSFGRNDHRHCSLCWSGAAGRQRE